MISKIKYYISNSLNPYENLAREKFLFDSVDESTAILYLWQNENTVVIGKNQNAWLECQCALIKEEGGFVARRLSGGGAVFHDSGNLNFTFISKKNNYNLETNLRVIQKAVAASGIETEISGRNDILAQERKFSGNAFYNSGDTCYHHGTILISTDFDKMKKYLTPPKGKIEAKGIKSVKSRVVNLSELSPALNIEDMKRYMLEAFNDIYSLKAEEIILKDAPEISGLKEAYESWDYIFKTPVKFTFSCEEYFKWGHVNLCLDVSEGIIKDTRLYTDSMDFSLSEIIINALYMCKFDLDSVKAALLNKLDKDIYNDIINMLKNKVSM